MTFWQSYLISKADVVGCFLCTAFFICVLASFVLVFISTQDEMFDLEVSIYAFILSLVFLFGSILIPNSAQLKEAWTPQVPEREFVVDASTRADFGPPIIYPGQKVNLSNLKVFTSTPSHYLESKD